MIKLKVITIEIHYCNTIFLLENKIVFIGTFKKICSKFTSKGGFKLKRLKNYIQNSYFRKAETKINYTTNNSSDMIDTWFY